MKTSLTWSVPHRLFRVSEVTDTLNCAKSGIAMNAVKAIALILLIKRPAGNIFACIAFSFIYWMETVMNLLNRKWIVIIYIFLDPRREHFRGTH